MNYITIPGIARITGVSEKTIRKYRGRLPGAVAIGRRVLYNEATIRKFIEAGGMLAADKVTGQDAAR